MEVFIAERVFVVTAERKKKMKNHDERYCWKPGDCGLRVQEFGSFGAA